MLCNKRDVHVYNTVMNDYNRYYSWSGLHFLFLLEFEEHSCLRTPLDFWTDFLCSALNFSIHELVNEKPRIVIHSQIK